MHIWPSLSCLQGSLGIEVILHCPHYNSMNNESFLVLTKLKKLLDSLAVLLSRLSKGLMNHIHACFLKLIYRVRNVVLSAAE